MMGNPQIALRLLKLFTKRIWDQKRRFMILTLEDPQARIADVFLMLAETGTTVSGSASRRPSALERGVRPGATTMRSRTQGGVIRRDSAQ
jgi:CRP-like cAMP-binding protein